MPAVALAMAVESRVRQFLAAAVEFCDWYEQWERLAECATTEHDPEYTRVNYERIAARNRMLNARMLLPKEVVSR